MDSNKKNRKIIKGICYYLLLSFIAILLLFPVLVMLSRSFMIDEEVMSGSVILPSHLTLKAYKEALAGDLMKYLGNTIIVALANCIIIPFMSAFVAYGFAKMTFKGKNLIFFVALCTTMIPTIVTQIPLFVMFSKIGWVGTYMPLIIPSIFGGGVLNVFLVKQYMHNVPKEMLEAAEIDGCNWFKAFFIHIIPLCRPVLILVAVQTFMAVWNDFTGPLIYLNGNEELFTLSVGIYLKFLSDSGNEFLPNVRMAVGVLMLIPEAILFIVFQKELVDGVSYNSVKG